MTTNQLQIAIHAPVLLIQQYYGQLASLNKKIEAREDGFPTKDEATIMTKISSVIKTIRPQKKSFEETLAIFTGFANAIAGKDPELAGKLSDHVQDYITTLATGEVPGPWGVNGVQNESNLKTANRAEQATSNRSGGFQEAPAGMATPQNKNEQWGARTTSGVLREAAGIPLDRVESILPPPRNRAERRQQERMLKKAAKVK